MKKRSAPRDGKKMSVRKHLPLFVRVHYDAVRNFSVSKLIGLGVMTLVAVFGVLLATQTVSPESSAAVSTITLTQLETNQVEAVISGSNYAPRFVHHLVSDNASCDASIYINMIRDGKKDPYTIFDDVEGWDEREHYQGDDSDHWRIIWEDDNSHEFKFLFPIDRPAGDYLCMRVSYEDNNADFKDYKADSFADVGRASS